MNYRYLQGQQNKNSAKLSLDSGPKYIIKLNAISKNQSSRRLRLEASNKHVLSPSNTSDYKSTYKWQGQWGRVGRNLAFVKVLMHIEGRDLHKKPYFYYCAQSNRLLRDAL